MASKRELKKDIDYLVGEVISDCYTYMVINGQKKRDDAIAIIESIIEKRNELIHRIKHPAQKNDRKAVKAHYREIQHDILKSIDEHFTKLSELTK
jgi:precorrin-2 methylase